MSTFKVYPRKIDVYFLTSNESLATIKTSNIGLYWQYAHSTNAYPTCRAAIVGAKITNPLKEYKANFSR
jgi:hypothetical protein